MTNPMTNHVYMVGEKIKEPPVVNPERLKDCIESVKNYKKKDCNDKMKGE